MFNKSKHIHLNNASERYRKFEADRDKADEKVKAKLREIFPDFDVWVDQIICNELVVGRKARIYPNFIRWLRDNHLRAMRISRYDELVDGDGKYMSISIITSKEHLPKVKEFAKWYVETAGCNTPDVYIEY